MLNPRLNIFACGCTCRPRTRATRSSTVATWGKATGTPMRRSCLAPYRLEPGALSAVALSVGLWGDRMRRREFVPGLAAAMSPLASFAQHASLPIVGFLPNTAADDAATSGDPVRKGLAKTGYIQGPNGYTGGRRLNPRCDQLVSGIKVGLVVLCVESF